MWLMAGTARQILALLFTHRRQARLMAPKNIRTPRRSRAPGFLSSDLELGARLAGDIGGMGIRKSAQTERQGCRGMWAVRFA
jgi:hypothetical protein